MQTRETLLKQLPRGLRRRIRYADKHGVEIIRLPQNALRHTRTLKELGWTQIGINAINVPSFRRTEAA